DHALTSRRAAENDAIWSQRVVARDGVQVALAGSLRWGFVGLLQPQSRGSQAAREFTESENGHGLFEGAANANARQRRDGRQTERRDRQSDLWDRQVQVEPGNANCKRRKARDTRQ